MVDRVCPKAPLLMGSSSHGAEFSRGPDEFSLDCSRPISHSLSFARIAAVSISMVAPRLHPEQSLHKVGCTKHINLCVSPEQTLRQILVWGHVRVKPISPPPPLGLQGVDRGCVCRKGMKPESPSQDDFCVFTSGTATLATLNAVDGNREVDIEKYISLLLKGPFSGWGGWIGFRTSDLFRTIWMHPLAWKCSVGEFASGTLMDPFWSRLFFGGALCLNVGTLIFCQLMGFP